MPRLPFVVLKATLKWQDDVRTTVPKVSSESGNCNYGLIAFGTGLTHFLTSSIFEQLSIPDLGVTGRFIHVIRTARS